MLCVSTFGFFVSTVGTGITGACADLESCAYQENQGVNKGMAICILVLNILSVLNGLSVCGDVDKFQVNDSDAWSRAYKPFFIFNSVEHEIFSAHEC